ncbi:UNVERIFIED_ORG: DNA-binding GntR family transcriptional regulator [Arthrobacter sp. UYCu721]
MSPVATISRRDGVVNEIRRAVVLGALKPGEKLTEVQLSEWLNVSRPTVREALNQMAQEGLLVQEPYRGLRVATLDAGAILDLAQTRVALDLLAASAILDDTTGRRMQMVETSWNEYSRSAMDDDPLVQHESHVAFHRSIWVASENALLLRLWPVTEAHLTILLAQDQAARADPVRAYRVHERLVEALRSADMEVIETAFTKHTINSAKDLIAWMEGTNETMHNSGSIR